MVKPKLIRITTVPLSLKVLLKGQLKFMADHFEVIGLSSSGRDLDEVQKNEGIRVEAIEMTRQITPFQDLVSLWKLYRFLKKEKPQIVHTHTPKAGIIGMLAAKLAGVPHRLHTVAGLPLMEASGPKRKLLDFVEKLTYRAATRVYPNSKGLYDFILENRYTKPSKLKIIANGSSNGIDTQFFNPEAVSETDKKNLKESLGIQSSDFIFVFVGRLVGDKGINELVAAFKELKTKNHDASTLISNPQSLVPSSQSLVPNPKSLVPSKVPKLLLVGSMESDLDPLEEGTLKAINNNPKIISVGYQQDVRPYFAISDALVFPSYREGFPNVVMQAGAMGLPAIVSDINGCNEIIVEGENGSIIPPKNAEGLYTAMQNIMNDSSYYKHLAANARRMIQSRYEQTVVWQAILEEYRKL